jgi:hypothetical protein
MTLSFLFFTFTKRYEEIESRCAQHLFGLILLWFHKVLMLFFHRVPVKYNVTGGFRAVFQLLRHCFKIEINRN